MLNKHIFKANAGEGKTRWLVEKALQAQDEGVIHIAYAGSLKGYINFSEVYEAQAHHKCNIPHISIDDGMQPGIKSAILTDDLINEVNYLPRISEFAEGDWYITMPAEMFI